MWKNKHLIVAMLVAPMLTIMAWFALVVGDSEVVFMRSPPPLNR